MVRGIGFPDAAVIYSSFFFFSGRGESIYFCFCSAFAAMIASVLVFPLTPFLLTRARRRRQLTEFRIPGLSTLGGFIFFLLLLFSFRLPRKQARAVSSSASRRGIVCFCAVPRHSPKTLLNIWCVAVTTDFSRFIYLFLARVGASPRIPERDVELTLEYTRFLTSLSHIYTHSSGLRIC